MYTLRRVVHNRVCIGIEVDQLTLATPLTSSPSSLRGAHTRRREWPLRVFNPEGLGGLAASRAENLREAMEAAADDEHGGVV